ncbi:protein disulfide-isomerase A3 [Eurytemora carolleeae]|uniref:protein disulfide-isomerase A3 n=1 Tax=Eurytemora carolleeae TaxID=1294199 RepID=UPI000C7942B6|nr:protein disulfide-isomerase A3 [Eurytemora carolleeae]|eukprot:XP_023330415.1 protein disulfide-isomerase A3-like [Eurytemora affinis]
MNPGPKLLNTKEDVNLFTDNDDIQVVAFFGAFSANLKEAYRLAVDRLGQSVLFGAVEDPDVVKEFGKYEDRIVMFRPTFLKSSFEDQIMIYNGPSERPNITRWIMDEYHGLIGLRFVHNQHQFPAPVVHIYINYDLEINHKNFHYLRNRFMEQANHFKGKTRFSISQINDYKDELKALGVNPETEFTNSERVIIIAFDKFGQKFVLDLPEFTFNRFKGC